MIKKIGIGIGVILAAAALVVLLFPASKVSGDRKGEAVLSSVATRADSAKPKASRKGPLSKKNAVRVARESVKKERPTFEVPSAEEERLSALQRKLLEEIRAALREDDYKTLMRLVHKMQSSDEWPDGIPNSIKKAALEALGWYGLKCLPEIVPFLADSNPEIVADAVSQWEDAIAECDSDREVAAQVKLASRVVVESDSVESILVETMNMRHSVAVETFKDVLANGNEQAKVKVLEQIADYTDDSTIKTSEQLEEWLKNNPDDLGDEEMYGGISDDANDG